MSKKVQARKHEARVLPKFRNSCPSKKVRYRDRREARNILHRLILLRMHGETDRQETRFYSCKLCRGFHLTSQRR